MELLNEGLQVVVSADVDSHNPGLVVIRESDPDQHGAYRPAPETEHCGI